MIALMIEQNILRLEWIRSEDQLADILTKPLTPSPFISIRDRLIRSTHTHHDEL
jgi:hypothetical protein